MIIIKVITGNKLIKIKKGVFENRGSEVVGVLAELHDTFASHLHALVDSGDRDRRNRAESAPQLGRTLHSQVPVRLDQLLSRLSHLLLLLHSSHSHHSTNCSVLQQT